ncbi:MAG TPA: hypothetical protein PKN45_06090 [Candidatus Limiplasma sp.]|nr:hypothetical protein [Candidatus Limiplasma sp.]
MTHQKVLSVLTAALLLVATGASAEKHERVYGVLNADGSARTVIDSIWLDNPEKSDVLTDSTALIEIQNTKDSRTFTRDGDTITWNAAGEDVFYQGVGKEPLPVRPTLDCTLDGQAAASGSELTGAVKITVRYGTDSDTPHLACSALLLDGETCRNVQVENGFTFTDGSRSLVVGYGVTACGEIGELPTSFTVSFDADHFTPGDVLTFVTSEPIEKAVNRLSESYDDANGFLRELTDDLTAIRDDREISGSGELYDTMSGVVSLLNGADALQTGADSLKTGADGLDTGAQNLCEGITQAQTGLNDLYGGLSKLQGNNDGLNAAASKVFDSLLTAATTELQTEMPDLPALTQANYAQVLGSTLDTLSESGIRAKANEAARQQVTEEVHKNEEEIRKQVTGAAQANVLQAVLKAANLNLTAEQYDAAVKAGQVTKEQQAGIDAAVKQQMNSADVQKQIDNAVTEQENKLVEENLASKEVQAKIDRQVEPILEQAKEGAAKLSALKSQLDEYAKFQQGLKQYTDGVTSAGEGAATLCEGFGKLADGAKDLQEGTEKLAGGAAKLASGAKELNDGLMKAKNNAIEKLLPELNDDAIAWLDRYEAIAERAKGNEHYDLVQSGETNSLSFILRSAWQ